MTTDTPSSTAKKQNPLKRKWTDTHKRRRRERLRALTTQRVLYLGLGWPILIIGLILSPTPIPVGIPMVIIGLFLLARGSRWVRERIIRIRHKWPEFSSRLNRLKNSMPAPVKRFLMRTDPLLYRKKNKN